MPSGASGFLLEKRSPLAPELSKQPWQRRRTGKWSYRPILLPNTTQAMELLARLLHTLHNVRDSFPVWIYFCRSVTVAAINAQNDVDNCR